MVQTVESRVGRAGCRTASALSVNVILKMGHQSSDIVVEPVQYGSPACVEHPSQMTSEKLTERMLATGSNEGECSVKRLVAVVGGLAAAVGVSVAVSEPAQADPAACPFDMHTDAGRQALQQSFDNYTAQVAAMQKEFNDQSPTAREAALTNGEVDKALAKQKQLIDERQAQAFTCWDTLSAPPQSPMGPLLPTLDPLPDAPLDERLPQPTAPMIVDSLGDPQSAVDCTKLRSAYDSLGPVTSSADAVAKLNHLKIPGLSQVTGVSLGLCGLDAIPAAIENPTLGNQQRVYDGACGAVDNFTNGIINPCGDTPVGSH